MAVQCKIERTAGINFVVLPAGYPRSVGIIARICWTKKYPLFPVAGGRGYK